MAEPIDDLIQDHLAGVLDAAGVAKLEQWLGEDRAHRERYVRAARFHADLRQLARDRLSRQSAGVPSARVSRLRVRRRPVGSWLPWLVAASLLVAVGGWLASRPTATAVDSVATVIAGTVRAKDGRDLVVSSPIAARAQVHVTRTATLRWQDGSEVELLAGSMVTVVADGVTLDDGVCNASIQKRPASSPFIIDSIHARVTVVGTRFRVIADTHSTAVAVNEGLVRVRDRMGSELALAPGQSAVARVTGFDPRTLTVSPTGADIPGSYPTVQAAVDAARPGDTVLLLPGRHLKSTSIGHFVTITRGGRPNAPLILRGQPGAELISEVWNGVLVEGASWVRLENLFVRGSSAATVSGNGIALIKGSEHIVVSGCDIAGFGGDGIACGDSAWIEIAGNRIDGCGGTSDFGSGGISVTGLAKTGTGPLLTISNNRILRSQTNHLNTHGNSWSGGNGITINGTTAQPAGSSTNRIRIVGNLIAGCAGSAILANRVVGIDLEDNTCHRNGRRPEHDGTEISLIATDCRLLRNLLIPSPGRRAWGIGRSTVSARTANRVWGGNDAPAGERLATSPFTTTSADLDQREDFTLRPGIGAGARP